ncbi:MAG: DUF748 domain-containing protein [Bacteroidales bacterium]|nr:DUF748 domain-containing protein [Bacteroidales bacterium]
MNTQNDDLAAKSSPVVEPQNTENAPAAEQPADKASEVSKNEEKPKKKRKRKPLRKSLKVLIIIAAVLVGLFLLLAAIISPVAHWYIEKHSKDLCGRVVTMDDLHINLFTGSVEIEGLVALEKNDKDTCLAFDRLFVDMSLWKLLGKTVQLNEITLEKPLVVIVQYPGRFNFTDICEFYKDDDDDDDKESTWVVDLRNISLTGGNAIYRDADVGSRFDLKQLAVKIPRIYFSTEKTDFGIDLKFDNGGGLNVKLLYGMKSSEYDLSLVLTDFELDAIAPYLRQYLNINDFGGKLTAKLNLIGNTDHILEVVAKGDVKISDVFATDQSDKRLAAVRSITLEGINADTKKSDYYMKKLEVAGVNFDYEVFADHHTFDNLVKGSSAPADTVQTVADTSSSSPLHLLVDELVVTESSLNYLDHTMHHEVNVPVSNIDIRCMHFDPDAPISLGLKALVGESGELMANCDGSLTDFSNMKLNVFLKNFKLTYASPYAVEYFAYPITDGVLSFASTNTLVNNNISSQNKVDIYNCQVDKKLKDFKAEYNIPMRAAVYILTDRKGNIQLDLPVSGNINDPTFSYRKIIFKTLCNLIVKVVTAPVDFLVKAINGEPDLFDDMAYDIRPQGLGSESSDRLNKIADAMKEKPELHLTIQQSVDIEENINEYALFNAQKEFYMQKHPGQLTMEDFNNIRAIKPTNKEFVDYVNKRLEGNTSTPIDIYAKCVALYDHKVLQQQIDANIERRNQQIVNHLATQGIGRDRVDVLGLGDKKTPKGKTLVSFSVRMPEE